MTQAHAVATPAPAVAHAGGLHAVAPVDSPAEREADRFADSFVSADHGPGWSFGEVPVHGGEQDRIEPALEARLASGLGADLSGVRLHEGPEATDLTQRAGASAVTIGSDISFAPGKHQPQTREGVRRLAHEVTHAVRHGDGLQAHRQPNGPVTPATTLAGLPEAERKRIQTVTTTPIAGPTAPELTDAFDVKMTAATAAPVVVAPGIDKALVHGLSNLAGDLTSKTTPAQLPPNSTVELDLDLTAQKGPKAPFRFTYTAPAAAAGQPVVGRVLVEQLGAANPPANTTKPADPQPGQPAAADPIADKLKKASITSPGFSGTEEQALRAAIALVPDSHLATLSGLTFIRKKVDTNPSTGAGDPTTAGKYFQKADSTAGVGQANTIVIFDSAFKSSAVVNVEGGVATSMASREILHEIGHAIDLRPLQQANEKAAGTLKDLNTAARPSGFANKDEADAFKDAKKADDAAQKALKGLTTASGTQTVNNQGNLTDVIAGDKTKTDFRDAVKKDGGTRVSTYGEKDWQDAFAESYSLYLSQPSALLTLRPATHAYFVKTYP